MEAKFAWGVLVGALAVVFIQADPLAMRLLRLVWLPLRTVVYATISTYWELGWEAHLSFSLLAVLAMRARAARQQHSVVVRHRLHGVLRSPWLGLAVPVVLVAGALVVLVAVALATGPATISAPPRSLTPSPPRIETRGWRGFVRRLAAAVRRRRPAGAGRSDSASGGVAVETHGGYSWAGAHDRLHHIWKRAGSRLVSEVARAVLRLRPALLGLALPARQHPSPPCCSSMRLLGPAACAR